MRMELTVTVQLDGEDISWGTLSTHVRRGRQSASFTYDRAYLLRKDAFDISCDLPLKDETIRTTGTSLFGAFEDCTPGRWGRDLWLRAERKAAREEGRAERTLWGATTSWEQVIWPSGRAAHLGRWHTARTR